MRLLLYITAGIMLFCQPLYLGHPAEGRAKAKDNAWEKAGIEKVGPAKSPQFTLKDINGKKLSLKDFKGKVVLLNFWATWCPPCKEEMPSLERLHSMFEKDGLKIVAINDYESPKKAIKFVKKYGYSFTVLIDETGKISEDYRAIFLPTTFIIDRNGFTIGRASGMRDWASPDMIKLFKELLKK